MVNTELVSLFANEKIIWDVKVSPTAIDIIDSVTNQVHASFFPTSYYQENAPVFLALVNGVPTTLYLRFDGCMVVFEHLKEQIIAAFTAIVNQAVNPNKATTAIVAILDNGYSLTEEGDLLTIHSRGDPLFVVTRDINEEGVPITLHDNSPAIVQENCILVDLPANFIEVFICRLAFLLENAKEVKSKLAAARDLTAMTLDPVLANTIH